MQDITEREGREFKKPKWEKRINKVDKSGGKREGRQEKRRPLGGGVIPLRLTIRINPSPHGGGRRAPGTLYHWGRGRCTPTHRRGPV